MKKRNVVFMVLTGLLVAIFSCTPNRTEGSERNASHEGRESGEDISPLFAPPTSDEIAAVNADWAARDVRPLDWQVLGETEIEELLATAVSHTVDGNTHYGFVRYPAEYNSERRYPVLIFNHGGQNGVGIDALAQFAEGCLRNFVVVVPSFRGEELRTGQLNLGTLTSEGENSEFDGDIDDVIALLNGTLENIAGADSSRIAVYGGSRGGAVTYLISAREPRIQLGVSFFGATNHMHSSLQEQAQSLVDNGGTVTNPVVNTVMTAAVTPYLEGELSLEEARLALLRRSVYHFADQLPSPYQVHHGTADTLVPVLHSHILRDRMTKLGLSEKEFTYFEYEDGGHGDNMPGSRERMEELVCTLGGAEDMTFQTYLPVIQR